MFNNLSGVELFYLVCGVVGGGLFLLRSIMIFAGLGGDDAAGDMHDGSIGDETTADFKMVSVHGITAFLLMFGLVGFLMMRGGNGAAASATLTRSPVAIFAFGSLARASKTFSAPLTSTCTLPMEPGRISR